MIEIESMFGAPQQPIHTQITTIPIDKLVAYHNQPFKLYSDEKLRELADDIRHNGLLSPIIVRPLPDRTYQILAGHNRVNACKLNEAVTIDAIIKHVSDEEADLILVQSNLQQRQTLSKKELALAYYLRNEALKKMSQRGSGNRSLEQLAIEGEESPRTIARYIKASRLIPDLLERFDNGEFSLPIAEMIASLTEAEQRLLDDYLEENRAKINTEQAMLLKDSSKKATLTSEQVAQIMRKNQKRQVKVTKKDLLAYVDTARIAIDPNDLSSLLELLSELKVLKYKII